MNDSCPADRVIRLDYHPDSSYYHARLRDLPWPVWLDSGFPGSAAGRYDIMAADPYCTLHGQAGSLRLHAVDGGEDAIVPDAFDALRGLLGRPRPAPAGLPFGGGAIGFLGYDLLRADFGLAGRRGLADWPDIAVGLYDWAIVVDHLHRRSYLVQAGRDPRRPDLVESLVPRLHGVLPTAPEPARRDRVTVRGAIVDNGMSRADYAAAFERIQRYIHDGDCYQANFAQRFRARVDDDAWSCYCAMRATNPAPYAALLEYPFGEVLSASPERFLSLTGRQVRTEPIKGTRPRGDDPVHDQALRSELFNSDKDRAENLMIVDLLRNDLGRVCEPGSIAVPRLFAVESFATVHHLVSTVTGRLRPDQDALDLLRACFPGGSITGAPKRRAMQIIDELEPHRREVYCGSVIRLGFDGNLDSSIAIRTALLRGDTALYWAGGGIVADSTCDAEYQESLDKAAAFRRLFPR
ncbi:MAG: aminodeoxychorismate synthase component I [Gammaproteobacteria bacterium]|nr:aminodeoxychorismate synthase component I [Gammaproteobacteria bacterium]